MMGDTYNSREAADRARVVEEARSWILTPYKFGADVKGKDGGIDCGMFLVRVFVDTGLVEPFDPRPYPEQWHLHQAAEKYLQWVERWARPVDRDPLPGDIIVFRFGKTYSHGSIVTLWPEIIHVRRPLPVHCERMNQSPFLRNLEQRLYSIWPRP